jgi:hypothetical protein
MASIKHVAINEAVPSSDNGFSQKTNKYQRAHLRRETLKTVHCFFYDVKPGRERYQQRYLNHLGCSLHMVDDAADLSQRPRSPTTRL